MPRHRSAAGAPPLRHELLPQLLQVTQLLSPSRPVGVVAADGALRGEAWGLLLVQVYKHLLCLVLLQPWLLLQLC